MPELGEILIRAREERGLTLDDAERDTRIARRYLEALEAEAFDVIPAPVFARGFLRSYAQYLGLDPQAIMTLYPRDPDPNTLNPPRPQRGRREQAPREERREPRREREPAPRPERQAPPPRERAPRPEERRQRRPDTTPRDEPVIGSPAPARAPAPPADAEPVIGVNVGVPAQTTRIQPDQAGQTRTLAVVIAAIAVVVGVIAIAFFIARTGDEDPATAGPGTATEESEDTPPPATEGPSVVPGVIGLSAGEAETILEEAGFVVTRLADATSTEPAGTVVSQGPAEGTQLQPGGTVIIQVSDGPE